jgi:light-regulated signal transduction histidine kinase (bacteriophytochrome)
VRAQLFDADEELAESLVGLGRILDVVRGIELPTRVDAEETADLTEVLRLTMRLVQSELRSSASLELDVKPVPPVAGSTAKLGQVVLNLLVNALQAMAWEPRARKMLSIRLVPEEGWVRFEVADSGPGIPVELLPHVFDAFSPAGRDRGAGLGLAIEGDRRSRRAHQAEAARRRRLPLHPAPGRGRRTGCQSPGSERAPEVRSSGRADVVSSRHGPPPGEPHRKRWYGARRNR